MMDARKYLLNFRLSLLLILFFGLLLAPLTKVSTSSIDGTDSVDTHNTYDTWRWSQNQVLTSNSSQSSSIPATVVDSEGTIHAVWQDQTDYNGAGTDYDIFYSTYDDSSGKWNSPIVVSTNSTSDSRDPDIAIDSFDNVHVVWYDETDYDGAGTDYDIFYSTSEENSDSWSSTSVLSPDSSASSYDPAIAIDSFNIIHVVWQDYTDYNGAGTDADIFYMEKGYINLGPSTTVLSNNTGASSRPSIAIDSEDNLHVVWDDDTDYDSAGTDTDIFYSTSEEKSDSWSSTSVLSGDSTAFSKRPDIAIDSSDNLYVAWDDGTDYNGAGLDADIFYTKYDGTSASWSSTTVLSTKSASNSFRPSIGIDSADNLHVVWYDQTDYNGAGTDYDIFYTRYETSTGSWIGFSDLSSNSKNSLEVDLSISQTGSVHIVWGEFTDYNGAGTDEDIFYKQFSGTPEAPTLGLLSPNPGYNKVALDWVDIDFAQSYKVYRSNSTVDQATLIDTTTSSEYIDDPGEPNTYIYFVRANNSIGMSDRSNLIVVDIISDTIETETETIIQGNSSIVDTETVTGDGGDAETSFAPLQLFVFIIPVIMLLSRIKKNYINN